MIQDILKTVVLSAVARVTDNINSLYLALGATIAVVVCSYFLYKRFFSAKPVEKTVTFAEEFAPETQQHSESTQPVNREEAFAAAMQAEQEAVEQALQKRNQIESDEHAEQADDSEHSQ